MRKRSYDWCHHQYMDFFLCVYLFFFPSRLWTHTQNSYLVWFNCSESICTSKQPPVAYSRSSRVYHFFLHINILHSALHRRSARSCFLLLHNHSIAPLLQRNYKCSLHKHSFINKKNGYCIKKINMISYQLSILQAQNQYL